MPTSWRRNWQTCSCWNIAARPCSGTGKRNGSRQQKLLPGAAGARLLPGRRSGEVERERTLEAEHEARELGGAPRQLVGCRHRERVIQAESVWRGERILGEAIRIGRDSHRAKQG